MAHALSRVGGMLSRAGVSPHEAFAYCMELVPVCLCVLDSWPLRTLSLRDLVPLRGWGEEVHSPRA